MKSIDRIAVVCAILTIVPSLVYGSGTIRYENTADLERLFSTSDLIVVGEIQAVEISCRNSRAADADVTIKAIEIWYGACDSVITVKVVRVKPTPEMSCGRYYDRSRPPRFEPGDKYLFLCGTEYDSKTKDYVEGYIVGMGGILSYDENHGDIWYNKDGDMFQMDLKNVANIAKRDLRATEPSALYAASDLVVVATGVGVQGGDPAGADGRGASLLADTPSASVVEVLKGAYSGETIRFNPNMFSLVPMRPAVGTGSTVVLFLKESSGEYGLVKGARGLAILENGRILSFSRKPTGASLDADRRIVKEVRR